MYANEPANRLVIVNGQVLHEGDTAAPGVTVEQIKLRSTVFAFRGQRVEVDH